MTGDLEMLSSGHVLVIPSGELDIAEKGRLDDLFEAATQVSSHLIADLSDVTFLDSTALSSILRWHQTAEVLGGELVLTGVSLRIRTLLEITQLDKVLEVYPTIAAALAADERRDPEGSPA